MNKYTKTYNVILDNMDLFEYRLRPISAIMYLQDAFARYTATKKMTAPDEFRKTRVLKNLHIRFNKETFLDDILICTTNRTELPDTYTHIIEKDGISVCDIVTVWEEKNSKNNIIDYNLDVKNEE